uniref:Uncharacterized protein n=1 Tax=Anguilla anguilla TaxID=7936 RepID=A0A0E9PTK9_ANGAN
MVSVILNCSISCLFLFLLVVFLLL